MNWFICGLLLVGSLYYVFISPEDSISVRRKPAPAISASAKMRSMKTCAI